MTDELTLNTMGTQVTARGNGAFAALAEVQRLETILTRFRASPLTRLNEAGRLEHPPVELVQAVQHALNVAKETRGWITPTILPALESAGYTLAPGDNAPGAAQFVPSTEGMVVTPDLIQLPAGVRLDLGGTAKGWIAEQAARLLSGNSLLDAGGDMQVTFTVPGTLGVETPDGTPMYLNLNPGTYGVATSSVLKRAWAGGHHLIDPRTGQSAQTPFVQATALASTVTRAETLAKLALLGADDILQALDGPDVMLLAYDHNHQAHEWRTNASGTTTWGRWAA